MNTASISREVKTVSTSGATWAPYCAATPAAREGSMSCTRANVTPGWAARLRACTLPMKPVPIKAKRSMAISPSGLGEEALLLPGVLVSLERALYAGLGGHLRDGHVPPALVAGHPGVDV